MGRVAVLALVAGMLAAACGPMPDDAIPLAASPSAPPPAISPELSLLPIPVSEPGLGSAREAGSEGRVEVVPLAASARRSSLSRALAKPRKQEAWAKGRILVPAATPPGERIRVGWIAPRTAPPRDAGEDGTFRLPLPKGLETATARAVGSRFLLDSPAVELRAGATALIEMRLGGVLRGRVSAPADVAFAPRFRLAGHVKLRTSAGLRSASIRSTGEFEFAKLPPGEAQLRVQPLGLAPIERSVAIEPGRLLELELSADAATNVSGSILGEHGIAIDRPVFLLRKKGALRASALALSSTSRSDGSFTLWNVPPPGGTLIAEADGCLPLEQDLPTLAAGEQLEGLRLVLRAAPSITGRLLDPDGQPVSARVRLRSARGISLDSDVSDAEGRFHFRTTHSGPLLLSTTSGKLRAELEGVQPGDDVILRLRQSP